MAIAKNTICLWYDKDAEAAARFYAETFPDSSVGAVHAVEEGDLLGQEQPRPAAVGGQLHRRQRGRRADLLGGQRVREDDPRVGRDV